MTVLTRWPDSANQIFDRVISNFFRDVPVIAAAPALDKGVLPLDISEDDAHVIVRASLPGFSKDEVEVELQDGILTVTATLGEARQDTSERFHQRERRVGNLSRRVALPGAVREDEAVAELRDGVLTVRVPHQRPEAARKVQIH